MEKADDIAGRGATPQQPLVSIITVVLNGADTLERAIKSVVSQTFRDFEYIIIDGGSTDGTLDIIRRYESHLTCWISEPDKGLYDAMNKGVALSKGEWVYFLGADDYLLDGFTSAAARLKDGTTVYYGNVYRPVADRIYDGRFSFYKLACRNICHQSIFYPRCVWKKFSYNLKYPVFADYDLNLRCFVDDGIQFKYIPDTIAVFTDEGGLSPRQADKAFEKDKLDLIKATFPSRTHMLMLARTGLLKILAVLGLQKTATAIYHFFLKVRLVPAKGRSGTVKKDEKG
ncbi:glycosyltransferase family 2 protein [Desulfosudis oleivorans]|uniref:Glycosyl transferase family 2 n=1 Tax=Desulfosudis oleivorans (strain DSM 6200 / JCM 39069 / Hxd3) TaxID=96561 RepID=A8ZU23_DESOH|nr:glycosyltransferase family 2 protein [Desulfosudis oleivorans]ABW66335.1 glycosyl transferase family 2 [Desulfosudis oleivorans Hxd3]